MTRSFRRALLSSALLSAGLLAHPSPAAGGTPSDNATKQQCAEADLHTQQLRRDEKLTAARAQLKICTDPACPALVRDDCAQRLDELDKVQPTLVFDVKDAQGRDMTEVKVSVDDQPLVDHISGAAIPVDPGAHAFTFETKGEKPVTRQLVLREGEKARHEQVRFGSAPVLVVVPPPASSGSRGSGQRKAGLVVGGLGLVGIGLGALFGELASSKWSAAQKACPSSSTCRPSQNETGNDERTNALTLATVSTVSFIAGGVLTAGGVTLLVSAPSGSSTEGRPAQGLQLVPQGGPGGGGVTLRGWF